MTHLGIRLLKLLGQRSFHCWSQRTFPVLSPTPFPHPVNTVHPDGLCPQAFLSPGFGICYSLHLAQGPTWSQRTIDICS